MGKEVIINIPTPDGKIVQKKGRTVDIRTENENWSSYTLENGAVLKVKQVITKVIMLDEKDPLGKPIYQIEASPIITVD